MLPADDDPVLHRALTELPFPRAPRTLLPRVLAAALAWAERPWYQRQWLTWPLQWQAASLIAFVLVLAGAALLLPAAGALARETAAGLPLERLTAAAGVAAQFERFLRETGATADAIGITWRVLALPVVAYGFALLTLMYAAFTAFSSALTRLSPGKALR